MTEEKRQVKNPSLDSSKEANSSGSKSRRSLAEEMSQGESRSRRRRRPKRRRPSKNSDSHEADLSARDGRGQPSESHPLTAVRRSSRRNSGSATPGAKSKRRPDAQAAGKGTPTVHTRTKHDSGKTSDTPRPAEGSAAVMTGARNDGGSISPGARPTPRPDAETPVTGTSGLLPRTRHDSGQTSDSPHPAEGSAAVMTGARNDGGSISPGARPTPRPDAEFPVTGTSGLLPRTRHDSGPTSDSPHPAEGSAVVMTGAKSDGGLVSLGTKHTPRSDTEQPDSGPSNMSAGTCDSKADTSASCHPVESPAAATTGARTECSLTSPHHKQTPPPDADSLRTGTANMPTETADGKVQAPASHLAEGAAMVTASASKSASSVEQVGGATLREFVPLTTVTEKISQAPAMYGSLGVFVGLACVAVVFMVWATETRRRRNECGSAECRDARAFLDSFLDKAIEPCSDFYRHVCRRWRMENVDGATLAEKAARDLIGSLHLTLLERARHQEATSQAEALLVNFYNGCRQFVSSTRRIQGRRFVRPNESDIDILRLPNPSAVLRKVVLLSLHRGISTLLSVNIVRHGDRGMALYVSKGRTLAEKLADTAHRTALTEYITEALEQHTGEIEASMNMSNIGAKIHELMSFDRITSRNEDNFPTAETVNASHFATLMQETQPRHWLEFVNTLLHGTFRLSEESPVMSHHLTLVKAAVEYFANNQRIGLIYIFLHIITEVGQFYHKSSLKSEADVCLTASQEVMGPSWLIIFSGLTRSLLSTPSRAGSIFYSVRRLSSQQLLDYAMEEADKMRALAALKGVAMLVDYEPLHPRSPPNGSVVPQLILADNFSYYYASLKALEARRRLQEPPYLAEVLIAESFMTGETTYSRLANAIVLPPAVRQPPMMYSTRVPLEFDTGTVGVLLAKEVFQAGLPSAGNGKSWYEQNVKRGRVIRRLWF
ncbi:hypothetical protein V5799_029328 [Amblyomma americanum]|uniref:Peptidase M13 N-terminal domain-containing protein n=1 Tax=Amblyomma americanum TaxID=6943 RepID=A0AAQ4ERI6_AMBAM